MTPGAQNAGIVVGGTGKPPYLPRSSDPACLRFFLGLWFIPCFHPHGQGEKPEPA